MKRLYETDIIKSPTEQELTPPETIIFQIILTEYS